MGGQVGQGLGEGLDMLAQAKFKQLAQQQQKLQEEAAKEKIANTYGQLYGADAGRFLAGLPSEKERLAVLQNPAALRMLSQQSQMQNPQGMQALQGAAGQPTADQMSPQDIVNMLSQPQMAQQQPGQEDIFDLFVNPREKREAEKLDIQRQELNLKQNEKVRNYLEKYDERETAARRDIRDYKTLERIAKTPEGKKSLNKERRLLERYGFGDWFRTPTADIINKISARLAQNASAAFGPGTRLTNFLEKTFQRSIPSLLNTVEGFQTVVKLNKYAAQAITLEEQARRQIIKENNNQIPPDINAQECDRDWETPQRY